MRKPFRIGISLGNLVQFNDGLGEFSRQLCDRVASHAAGLRSGGVEVFFHVHPGLVGCFGSDVYYLEVHRSQEYWHTQPMSFAVWHTLNQLNRYPAPRGTTRRILTIHDLNYLYYKNGFSRWRDHLRMKAHTRRHDEWVAISHFVRNDVLKHIGWNASSTTIYNGASDLTTHPQKPVDGLQEHSFLLHLSRMTASKNVDALLDMMCAWPCEKLVLAGPDSGRNDAIRVKCQALGISDRVRVLTSVTDEEKAWLYAHCKLFVFPSLTEGFGLPPIEAMNFGLPVVLSDRTSLPEVGGKWAHYAHDLSATGLRQACEKALKQPFPGHEVREHAKVFNWDRCADQYMELWLKGFSGIA
jgi:glycosyltransferase involved in cell wall biosynthesis